LLTSSVIPGNFGNPYANEKADTLKMHLLYDPFARKDQSYESYSWLTRVRTKIAAYSVAAVLFKKLLFKKC